MKIITRTIGTLLVTAIIGVFTVIIAAPRKTTKANGGDTTQSPKKKDKENLFI